MTVESAYFSAVLIANALVQAGHAQADDAVKLKEALAQGVTHPDILRDPSFQELWNARGQFSELHLDGDSGAVVEKHAQILKNINL